MYAFLAKFSGIPKSELQILNNALGCLKLNLSVKFPLSIQFAFNFNANWVNLNKLLKFLDCIALLSTIIGANENSMKELFCFVNEITPGVIVLIISGSEKETISTLESFADCN
jgi:hypothetical protein